MRDENAVNIIERFGAQNQMGIRIPIEGDDGLEQISCVDGEVESVHEIIGALRAECAALEDAHLEIGIDLPIAKDAMIEAKQHAGEDDELTGGDQIDDARVALDESF